MSATTENPRTNLGNFVQSILAWQVLFHRNVTNRAITPMRIFWSILMIIAMCAQSLFLSPADASTAPVLSTDPPIQAPSTLSSTFANGRVGIHGIVSRDITAIRLVRAYLSILTQSPMVIAADDPQILTAAAVTSASSFASPTKYQPIPKMTGIIARVSTQLTISPFTPMTPTYSKSIASSTILTLMKNYKSYVWFLYH